MPKDFADKSSRDGETSSGCIEFDGERYRQASTHQKQWGARVIAELVLGGDECILDVGCGDGGLTAQLADLVPRGRVLGLDASTGMIDTARTNERPNLSFVLMNIVVADCEAEFDLIFSNAALHWIADHEKLLSILHRALKADGVLRADFGAEGNCPTWFRVARQLMAADEFRGAFQGFDWPYYMPDIETYDRLLRKSPFSEVKVWGENADCHFPSVETMLRWLDQPAIVPFIRHLNKPIAERFQAAAAARMTEETLQPDGTCFEAFQRINVLAKK